MILRFGVLGVLAEHRPEAVEHLAHGLVELGLARVAPDDVVVDRVQLGDRLVGHARTLGSCSAPTRCRVRLVSHASQLDGRLGHRDAELPEGLLEHPHHVEGVVPAA